MADIKKLPRSTKIVDVAHPGKTPPSPNSKSVIITHRPIMKDPMMNSEGSAEAATSEEAVAVTVSPSRTSSTVVRPPTEDTANPAPAEVETKPNEAAIEDDKESETAPAES